MEDERETERAEKWTKTKREQKNGEKQRSGEGEDREVERTRSRGVKSKIHRCNCW